MANVQIASSPVNTTATHWQLTYGGPFRDGSGNLYWVGSVTNNTSLSVYKSTDDGQSWAEQTNKWDLSASLGNTFAANARYSAVFDGTSIHVVAADRHAGNSLFNVFYNSFNTSTGNWAGQATVSSVATEGLTHAAEAYATIVANGEITVCYDGAPSRQMGTWYRRAWARRRVSGSWGTAYECGSDTGIAGNIKPLPPSPNLGQTNEAVVFCQQGSATLCVHRWAAGTGALPSTTDTIASGFSSSKTPWQGNGLGGHAFTNPGTVECNFVGRGVDEYATVHLIDSSSADDQTVSSATVNNARGLSLYDNGSTTYALYRKAVDGSNDGWFRMFAQYSGAVYSWQVADSDAEFTFDATVKLHSNYYDSGLGAVYVGASNDLRYTHENLSLATGELAAAHGSGAASATATLSVPKSLQANGTASASASAVLSAPKSLQASGTGSATSGTATLTTKIKLAAAGTALATASALLTTAIPLQAAASASASGTASLTLTKTLQASGAASATSSAASLTTAIPLQASATGAASATASLTNQIRFQASGTGTGTGSASLTVTVEPFAASGVGVASGSGSLTTAIPLLASGAGAASANAALTAPKSLQASGASAATSATASLTTAIPLQAGASGVASATASLTNQITLQASGNASASGSATLTLPKSLQASGAGAATQGTATLTLTKTLQASGAGVASGTADLTTLASDGTARGLLIFPYASIARNALLFPYGPLVRNVLAMPYQALESRRQVLSLPYVSVGDPARAVLEAPYGQVARALLEAPYRSLIVRRQVLEAPYRSTQDARNNVAWPYGYLGYTPARAVLALPYGEAEQTPAVFPLDDYIVLASGRRLEFQKADISVDAGDLGWRATITLANRAEGALIELGDAITLHMGGTAWSLRVSDDGDEYALSKDSIDGDVTLTALSPALFDADGYAPTTSVSFNTTTNAKAAAEQLAGQSIDWQILDWPIAKDRLVFDDVTPLAVAQKIPEAIGAVLGSNPDGTLRAYSLSPVAVPQLATAIPDGTIRAYTVRQRLYKRNRTKEFNRVVVIDVLPVYRDQFEAKDDATDWHFKDVYVYPSPWRSTLSVSHSRGTPPLYLYSEGTFIREELVEALEFKDGRASLPYPVMTILSTEWLKEDLGGLTFDPYTHDLIAAEHGYSLLRISFLTKGLGYRAYSTIETPAQLLLDDSTQE